MQDSWKATKKLTAGVWRAALHLAAVAQPLEQPRRIPAGVTTIRPRRPVIDRAGGFIVSGDPYNGIVLPGNGLPKAEGNRFPQLHTGQFDRLFHGLPDGLAETHWTVFQPRLGLAYGMNNKTSLRAGMGMFANRTAINRDTALGGNAPFQPQQIVINGSADAPAGAVPRVFPVHDDDPGSRSSRFRRPGTGTPPCSANCLGRPPSKSAMSGGAASTISANATSTNCCPEPRRPTRASTRTLCVPTSAWEFSGWRKTPASPCTTACKSAPSGASRTDCSSTSPTRFRGSATTLRR